MIFEGGSPATAATQPIRAAPTRRSSRSVLLPAPRRSLGLQTATSRRRQPCRCQSRDLADHVLRGDRNQPHPPGGATGDGQGRWLADQRPGERRRRLGLLLAIRDHRCAACDCHPDLWGAPARSDPGQRRGAHWNPHHSRKLRVHRQADNHVGTADASITVTFAALVERRVG
jgi:hypothetical protein